MASQNEHIAYYRNDSGQVARRPGEAASASFVETSAAAGLVADSKPWVGWGCSLADFDNDGWPDAFVANGHLDDNRKQLSPMLTYAEPPLLYRNVAGGGNGRRFQLSTRDAGPYLADRHVSRGAAFGDFDDDGDVDIVVNHMVGTRSSRDAIGALVRVEAGRSEIIRQKKGGCSMQSTNDSRLLIGLGVVDEVSKVTVRWPSGAISTLDHLPPDRTYRVVEPSDKGSDRPGSTAPDDPDSRGR
jgi:hypothetical protein